MESLDPEIVAMLMCPVSEQPLRLATAQELTELNAQIGTGQVVMVGGDVVKLPVDSALVREDGKIAYAIRDGIMVLTAPEGIVLPGKALSWT